MILILTTEAGDFSHLKFIDWLEYYNADYEILTGESIYRGDTKIIIKDNNLLVNGRNYTKDINVVFNRRWLTQSELPRLSNDNILNSGIKNTLSSELLELRNYLSHNLKNAFWIPNNRNVNVNKITLLQEARKIGIKTPSYIITNNKKELIDFYNQNEKIITKAIGNFPRNYIHKNFLINPIYTKVVTEEIIDKVSDTFFMSIFQQYISKRKEYRVLFFNDKCYTVELLSQENEFSKIDSRAKENEESNIRIQRSSLPLSFERNILKLMKKVGLNIGCIDIIESTDGEFYFLEVNPVGQISGYSLRGGLNFEKEIVEQMIMIDNGNTQYYSRS